MTYNPLGDSYGGSILWGSAARDADRFMAESQAQTHYVYPPTNPLASSYGDSFDPSAPVKIYHPDPSLRASNDGVRHVASPSSETTDTTAESSNAMDLSDPFVPHAQPAMSDDGEYESEDETEDHDGTNDAGIANACVGVMQGFMDIDYSTAVDEVCQPFIDQVNATFQQYKQVPPERRAEWHSTFAEYDKRWKEIMRTRLIMSPRNLFAMIEEVKSLIEHGFYETKLAKDTDPRKKPIRAIWVRQPIPFTPKAESAKAEDDEGEAPAAEDADDSAEKKKKKRKSAKKTAAPKAGTAKKTKSRKPRNGPWRVRFLAAPGYTITAVNLNVPRAVDTAFQIGFGQSAEVLPTVRLDPEDTWIHNEEEGVWELAGLSFEDSSGGRACELDFGFHVGVTAPNGAKQNCIVNLRSMPFAVTSNINQWFVGEGRFVVWNAFEGKKAEPSAHTPFPLLFNYLQFSHLTATRQIASRHYLNTLYTQYMEAEAAMKRKRAQKDSGRGKKNQAIISLFESFAFYRRARRLLTPDEARSAFPTEMLRNNDEVVTLATFEKCWPWYGKFLYHLYTGTKVGSQPRLWWLDHILYMTPPTGPKISYQGPLSLESPLGAAILRTSRQAGDFTTCVHVIENGERKLIHKPLTINSNDFAMAFHCEGGVTCFVRADGAVLDKGAVINQFVKIKQLIDRTQLTPDDPDYRDHVSTEHLIQPHQQ